MKYLAGILTVLCGLLALGGFAIAVKTRKPLDAGLMMFLVLTAYVLATYTAELMAR